MNYFSLFSSCVLTQGFRNSCLVDLERATYCSIPNELYQIIKLKFNIALDDIEQGFDKEDFLVIKEYLSFLEDNKFIYFHLEKQELAHDISKDQFSNCHKIEDLIFDLKSPESFYKNISKISADIEKIQLRYFYPVTITELEDMIEILRLNGHTNVEIILKHHSDNSENSYIELFHKYKLISRVCVMDFLEDKFILPNYIIALKQPLVSHKQCGVISEKLFYPNLRTYLSSKNCNSCLSRKISIDVEGEIKNCPSMQESFGNIRDTSLEGVLRQEEFLKFWNITKDEIEVCRDCEFRYICTDCRAYREDPFNDYSKPLKCGYNPYTNKWENWSESPLKHKAIHYYGLQDFG